MNNLFLKPTTKLKPFQIEGVKFLLQRKKAILGDGVGLGKTLQTLTVFSYYKSKFPKAKLLVLTNKSITVQFASEVEKFFDNLSVKYLYEAEKDKRHKAYKEFTNSDLDILITNYASIKMDLEPPKTIRQIINIPEPQSSNELKGFYSTFTLNNNKCTTKFDLKKAKTKYKNLIQKQEVTIDDIAQYKDKSNNLVTIKVTVKLHNDFCHFQQTITSQELSTTSQPIIIGELIHDMKILSESKQGLMILFDEAVALKDTTSITYKAGATLSALASKVIAITATVTKGHLEEAYNIFKCIGINLTATKKDFINQFCIMRKSFYTINGKHIDELVGYKNIPQFKQLIQPHFIGRSKKLVAKELPAFTIKRYIVSEDEATFKALQHLYTSSLLEGTPANIGRIRIALTTPQLILPTLIPETHINNKLDEFISILQNDFTDEKVIVYIDYKSPIDLLEKILPKHLPDKYKNILKITGDVDDRFGVINTFNTSPDHNLLFINSAAKEGLNLQVSGHLFFLTQPFKAGDYVQIAGRISRIGTTHTSLTIHNIVQEDSTDTDSEVILQIGLKLMKEITPSSVEEGLEQPHLLSKSNLKNNNIQSDEQAEVILLKSFTSRSQKYIKKNITF